MLLMNCQNTRVARLTTSLASAALRPGRAAELEGIEQVVTDDRKVNEPSKTPSMMQRPHSLPVVYSPVIGVYFYFHVSICGELSPASRALPTFH